MNIVILHFRSAPRKKPGAPKAGAGVDQSDSAGTDGVSLEMKKRAPLLEAMGHTVSICSAYPWAEHPIPALEFDRESVMRMMRNLFGTRIEDYAGEAELTAAFQADVSEMKAELRRVLEASKADLLFVHNVLCLPIHPVATVALTEVLQESGLPCVAINHDILSEGAYKFTPTCDFARRLLAENYPPKLPNLFHWTINTRNRKALAARGVEAKVIHDCMDFDTRPDPKEHARIRSIVREKFSMDPNDIVLFVGARIVPNKQTELAGQLAARIDALRGDLVGKTLYHGGTFTEKNRMVLALAGRPERAFMDYRDKLYALFDRLKLNWAYVGDVVRPQRAEAEGCYALYPDMYAMADFVLYPSGWEGFGNQLLEAFAAGVPSVVFEYPVFQEDIGPKGVEVVSLGDALLGDRDADGLVQIDPAILDRAAREVVTPLVDAGRYRAIAERNFELSRKYFGFDVMRAHLGESAAWAASRRG